VVKCAAIRFGPIAVALAFHQALMRIQRFQGAVVRTFHHDTTVSAPRLPDPLP